MRVHADTIVAAVGRLENDLITAAVARLRAARSLARSQPPFPPAGGIKRGKCGAVRWLALLR